MIEFFMPMKKIPTTTHQQKKVTTRNGYIQYYEPERLKDAREKFMSSLYPYIPDEQFKGPLRLTVKWLFPVTKTNHSGEYKETKPDLDNLVKLLKDCMTHLTFWKDDAQVASLVTEKFYSDVVGIYIKIESLNEER